MDPKHEPMLYIYNYTNDAMYVYYSSKESIQLEPKLKVLKLDHYTFIDKNGNRRDTVVYPDYRIESHSYSVFHDDGIHVVGKFRPFLNKDYVNFFFIKESTMRSYTWEEICKKQLYEKKIKYSYKELEKLHYRISYKPY